MPKIFTLPKRPVQMTAASARRSMPPRQPVAGQIRDYYTLLHTDYIVLQRQAALARVQQALEPLTAGLISGCGG